MSHSIDHSRLIKAAENLGAICDAGYGEQIEREYYERKRDAGIIAVSMRDPWLEYQERDRAKLLALLTSAPFDQCLSAVREASGTLPEREVGLGLLQQLAGEVRRYQAQAARQRPARRTA